jgi:cobalamin biosynthesis protein CobT
MLKSVNLLRTVVIVVICMFISSTIALTNNIKILDPGVLPDSPAYELKLKLEDKELAALNDPLEKAKLSLKMADLRLLEAMVMEEMAKPQFVNGLVKDYNENLTQVLLNLAEAFSEESPGVDEALVVVSDAAIKDIDILEGLLDLIKLGYIPEESQCTIELAINISQIVSNVSIEVLVEIADGELEVLLEEAADDDDEAVDDDDDQAATDDDDEATTDDDEAAGADDEATTADDEAATDDDDDEADDEDDETDDDDDDEATDDD